jgi:hypothetical protein
MELNQDTSHWQLCDESASPPNSGEVAAARPTIHVAFISLMASFEAERGAKAQGPRQRPAKLELNPAVRSSDKKEATHDKEEEKEEDGEVTRNSRDA